MNPMHQLTRRPVKAAFGALLLALAGVILALSGGQFWAAVQTRAGVEETYTTVAVVTGGLKATSPGSPTTPLNAYEAEYCLMDWAREGVSFGLYPPARPMVACPRMTLQPSLAQSIRQYSAS